MALETPTWMNLCFVEKILRKSEGDNSIQVTDVFTKPATNKGDNYTSDMFRVNIEFTHGQDENKITDKKSIIIKVAPIAEGVRQDLIEKADLFGVEILMMTDTLKKMNKLLEPKYRVSGKCLYVQKNPTLLVIEDLAVLGFRMACRQSGLDLDHCVLALRGLARFHAASVAICEKEPNHKNIYTKGMFSADYPTNFRSFFIQSTHILAKEAENWPEVKRYVGKLSNLADRIYQIGIDMCKVSEDEFNVITHGDFWVNNMLFKYNNEGKPIEHIMVDFQICKYSTPAIDLHYFFNTSPAPVVYENHKSVLLNEYCNTLASTMKQLNCKTRPPTMEELKTSLKRRAAYGMIAAFTVLPLMLIEKDNVKDLDEIMGKDGSVENPAYKNEAYRKVITKRIPLYDEWGLLDP
ncbi:uncharacterized protein LOC109854513 [Pseudomyrmex gracilis]|uniref:uncharacterized protein LOC109854513 n=1 Tax=Pseudomyrmex gracilis TaxID=219809 RepID=UPI000994AA6E|nr:uncharacterized protein LOC109854513 [Pseudomyrmex gracilis]